MSPVWYVRMMCRSVGRVVDFDDVVYVTGIVMVSVGAERAFGCGYGLVVAGSLLLAPLMPRLCAVRKGLPK